MALRVRTVKGKQYWEYVYWTPTRIKTIYCGVAGSDKAKKKLERAKERHAMEKMERKATRIAAKQLIVNT